MTSATPILTAVRDALETASSRKHAAYLLRRKLPVKLSPEALMSWVRDDRALGISIVRRSPSAV